MRRRLVRAAIGIAAILALGVVPSAARAGALSSAAYPSAACPSTLQDCIASMAPGGVLRIVTNVPIDEDVTIEDSLTMKAGNGFQPRIAGDLAITRATGTITVTVQGLTVQGQVRADLTGGTSHVVRLRELHVTEATRDAIDLRATVVTRFEITGSDAHTDGDGDGGFEAISVQTNHPSGTSTILLRGNRVDGTGNPDSGNGIFVGFDNFGTGHTDAHIYNNVVFDTGRCPGCDLGITAGLWVNTEFAATSDVDIVGNTFARSGVDGVIVRALLDQPGGFTTVNVYDNIVSHSDHRGLRVIADPSRMKLRADHNDYFANDDGNVNESGEPFGTHDRAVGPRYVALGAGDLRLQATSPLIDAGLVCNPGELGRVDAAGHRRVAGASVDLGAFERGAGLADGEVWFGTSGNDAHTGTSGADVLCGLGGQDQIAGSDGGDHLVGGGGPDTIRGGKGPDRLLGEAGDDVLCARDGIGGNDVLSGGLGSDRSRADAGDTASGVELPASC